MKKLGGKTDHTSIGAILLSYGLTPCRLAEAMRFQDGHGDILLGEACVRLGFVSKAVLEEAVMEQRVRRKNHPGALLRLATAKTRHMTTKAVALTTANLRLAEKLGR